MLGRLLPIPALLVLLLLNIPFNASPAADTIYFSGDTELTENLTVAAGERLVIEAGTVLTLGLDVNIRVEGGLVCGSLSGDEVLITSNASRLSGSIMLVNCHEAVILNTRIRGVALALEAVYSSVSMSDCTISNGGVGVLSYESVVNMKGCVIRDCDMAVNAGRTGLWMENCTFVNDTQALVMYTPLYRISSFYHFELKDIRPLMLLPEEEMGASVSGSTFRNCGVGISGEGMAYLNIRDSELVLCKKGIDSKLSPGRVDGCTFLSNSADLSIFGHEVVVSDNRTPPLNYTIYHDHSLHLTDADALPLAHTRINITLNGSGKQCYTTDEHGSVGLIFLLHSRSVNGSVTSYTGYNVTVEGYPGSYPLEENVVLHSREENGGSGKLFGRIVALLLLCVMVAMGVGGMVYERMRRGKHG